MATSFDATARINLDIKAFAQGAQGVTKAGGTMEKIFHNLHSVMSKIPPVEKAMAASLRTSLGVYNQISTAAKNYASAVQALHKAETSGANGAKLMVQAFHQLSSALGKVQGLSEKEFQRVTRTVQIYERLANVLKQLATAQKAMSSITQNAIQAQQKDEAAKKKAAETATKLAQNEEKLAISRERLAQTALRSAQNEEKLAQARQRLNQATSATREGQVSLSGSSFALRNTVGELEQSFQSLFNVLIKVPTALASAAISQETAFAQVARVVGEAEAESAGLLTRFQEIAQQAPISFEEVARIGQLGAAIGISEQNLGDFTDTIVKFSLTTGVASEEATIMLGRIAQMQDVPISQIDQLGSAILALGTASAATDQEILRVNSSIATVSNLFGLTAQQTSGLAAALATLQVRPELSRGALTRVFNDLQTAVSAGGVELAKLSKVMGMTDAEVLKLFNNPAMRGDFLLAFIDGLSRATGAGGDVQSVLRELGINAVRDIDVFSRLANNVDVVRESFDRANVEFARGTELNRQSKGIYQTTSAEIQNLSDAFQTLLATLGGPLAKAIGSIASFIADEVIAPLSHLGPIIPIFGTLASLVIVGASAWTIYQVALAKTISALIATRELQARLGVTTLSAGTALNVYRNGLSGVAATTGAAAQATNVYTAAQGRLATATAAAMAGHRANLVTNQAAAVAAAQNVAATQTQARTVVSAVPGFRAYATAMDFAATSAQRQAAATAAAVPSTRGLAMAASLAAVPLRSQAVASNQVATASATMATVGTFATNSMRQQTAAAAAAAIGQRGLATATAQSSAIITASAATTARATTAIASTGIAARAASLAFGPWGLALAAVAILLGPMISKSNDFASAADKISSSAMEATGGTQALANAIKADTDAAITAAGGVRQYTAAVKDGSKEALGAIGVYRTITTQKSDLAEADRKSAEAARDEAEQRIRAIEATKGTKKELQAQAQGYGSSAEAARRYIREIDAATNTVNESTEALGKNTLAIGENVKQWITDTAQAALEQSKLADGSDLSARALAKLGETGVDVGEIMSLSLEKPELAIGKLDGAIKDLNAQTGKINLFPDSAEAKKYEANADAARRLKTFLEALRTVIQAEGEASTKGALAKKLLKDALDTTGDAAASASGRIKLTKDALEDLEVTGTEAAEAMTALTEEMTKFGTPMTAFAEAAKKVLGEVGDSAKDALGKTGDAAETGLDKASDAVTKFSLKAKGGLDAYIKELEKIAKAQRDWTTNLIKISATLGPEIAAQFRKLGPEAAPAVAELANLSVAELAKLGPKLAEIGSVAMNDLASSIVQNSGKIENATLQTRTLIADLFGNAAGKAKTAEQFTEISNQYAALVAQFGKLKGIKIDISADDAKAFKSLNDLSLYLDLVGSKVVTPKVALDIVKAQGDIAKIQAIIAEVVATGKLDAKGKATLDGILFQAQLAQLTTSVAALNAEGKLDAKGKGKLDDAEYKAKIEALKQFLLSTEGAGLLNPKGKAQLNDTEYRAQMQSLANLILGEEQAGKFDVNGDGKLDDDEFKKLLEGLKAAVSGANKGKLDPKGKSRLSGTTEFKNGLTGIVNAAYRAGGQITQALTRSATVSVGYLYYQKNSPPKTPSTMAAANGGWINGPGGPKSDVIPAMLSNGEFVVSAAAAQRFGALLEVINRSGGRGFSGVSKYLESSGITGGPKPVRLATNTGNTALNMGMVQRMPPESVSVHAARMAIPQQGPTSVFNINNQYPQAEATSTTINRSLAYAATIGTV